MEHSNHWFIGTDNLIKDTRINATQKLLLMKLNALQNSKGYAFCSNEYLSDLFNINKQNVSKNISKLQKLGYIECIYDERNYRKIKLKKVLSNATIPVIASDNTLLSNATTPIIASDNTLLSNATTPIIASNKYNNKVNNKDNNKVEIKEIKKEKAKLDENVEIVANYFDDKEVNVLFNEFLENRKEVFGKKINTEISIKKLINKLNKFDDDAKKEMINNSIENGWKGLFEIKSTNRQGKVIGSTDNWYKDQHDNKSINDEELKRIKDRQNKM